MNIPEYLREFVIRVGAHGELVCRHQAIVTACKVCMSVIAARAAKGRY